MRGYPVILLAMTFFSCSQHSDLEVQKKALRDAADLRLQKVTAQLKADCDSSLLKETYRRVRLLQRSTKKQTARKPVKRA